MTLIVHLVESTLFAGFVWLLALAFRHNRARVRHALWMAASLKFLVPFSVLVTLGSHIPRPYAAPVPHPQMRFVMVDPQLPPATPNVATYAAPGPRPTRRDWMPAFLWTLWAAGCIAILLRWLLRWRTAAVHLDESATPTATADFPVPIRTSQWNIEPGVVGIFRPVLVLPAGIEERLTRQQLESVLAHELCHIRHRDNLAAAVHMVVEALFWFHPLVWWIGARLVDERERACDEEVLQLGSDPATYAESILRVCQLCIESPVPCVSGISGADLKQRIRSIMHDAAGRPLQRSKKLMLAVAATVALAVPLAIGVTQAARAQVPATAPPQKYLAASFKLAEDQRTLESLPRRTPGRIRWKTQLIYLVAYAYDMEWWRIDDKDGMGVIYELEATMPPDATEADRRLMMQSLLLERLQMQVHRETKPAIEGYALTLAKDGPKMEEAKEPPTNDEYSQDGWIAGHLPDANTVEVEGHYITMRQLTDQCQRTLKTLIVDQTGLTGRYNLRFQYAREGNDYSGLIGAVKQIGLKMEKYKGPVEFLVIDSRGKLIEN